MWQRWGPRGHGGPSGHLSLTVILSTVATGTLFPLSDIVFVSVSCFYRTLRALLENNSQLENTVICMQRPSANLFSLDTEVQPAVSVSFRVCFVRFSYGQF